MRVKHIDQGQKANAARATFQLSCWWPLKISKAKEKDSEPLKIICRYPVH
jgi:hypothetical protein